MKDMAVAWIAQKGLALRPLFELLRRKGHLAPASHQATDIETPMGIQVVHHPIIARHAWQLCISLLEMRHKVWGLTGGPNGPSHLARGHRQGVDQDAGAVAAVLMFASLAPARLGRGRGGCPRKPLAGGRFRAGPRE